MQFPVPLSNPTTPCSMTVGQDTRLASGFILVYLIRLDGRILLFHFAFEYGKNCLQRVRFIHAIAGNIHTI